MVDAHILINVGSGDDDVGWYWSLESGVWNLECGRASSRALSGPFWRLQQRARHCVLWAVTEGSGHWQIAHNNSYFILFYFISFLLRLPFACPQPVAFARGGEQVRPGSAADWTWCESTLLFGAPLNLGLLAVRLQKNRKRGRRRGKKKKKKKKRKKKGDTRRFRSIRSPGTRSVLPSSTDGKQHFDPTVRDGSRRSSAIYLQTQPRVPLASPSSSH